MAASLKELPSLHTQMLQRADLDRDCSKQEIF